MPWTDAFAPVNARNKAIVMQNTWGHLAPEKNRRYDGRIVFAIGCFGSDSLNPTAIFCEFEGLDSSPWFYDELQEFMSAQETNEGCVYEFNGTFKNYEFKGKIVKILDVSESAN